MPYLHLVENPWPETEQSIEPLKVLAGLANSLQLYNHGYASGPHGMSENKAAAFRYVFHGCLAVSTLSCQPILTFG
jgi:hypothetical protein